MKRTSTLHCLLKPSNRAATALLLLCSLLLGFGPSAAAIGVGGPSDCDDNAIIKCGAHSTAELLADYKKDPYVQKVYADFGISGSLMADLPNHDVAGSVSKSGNVYVDGNTSPVATGAITGGRQDIPGSTKVSVGGITYFKRAPSVSFKEDSLPAFIHYASGKFQYAIIASCGNAVSAKPVPTPPKPKPQPTTPPTTPSPTTTPTVTPTTPPTQTASVTTPLPNTGPADVVAVFVLSTLAGAFAYRRYLARKLTSQ